MIAIAILYAASIVAELVVGLPDPAIFGFQLLAVILVGLAWYVWTRRRRFEPDKAKLSAGA